MSAQHALRGGLYRDSRKYGDRGYDACGVNPSTSRGGMGSVRDYHPLSGSTTDLCAVRQAAQPSSALYNAGAGQQQTKQTTNNKEKIQ